MNRFTPCLRRLAAAGIEEHGHGLCSGSGGLVEQTRIGHFHAGQITDHGLEIQQGLEPPLRDLSLVGGVRCVPARDSPKRFVRMTLGTSVEWYPIPM